MTLRAGMYSVFLKDWMSVFPRSQFLILKAEDYYSDMTASLTQVFKFLDVHPYVADINVTMKIRNSMKGRGRRTEPMLETTEAVLREFYAPFNQELAALLGDDRFLWEAKN